MEILETEFKPGDVIAGRYRVEAALGRGGMGAVYQVVDQQTSERRALKTLLPEYVNSKNAVRRFAREVEVVRRLNHPSIVKVYDAKRVGSLLYYTMDFIEGKTLRDFIVSRGKLGIGSTVRILALLAEALEYAHLYTIHRDLSPENVMVLADGSVRLLDFGLAKLTDNTGAFTMIGDRLGKEQYKAPEQRANAAEVDGRADLYSLGIMFFVMLAGRFAKPGERLTEVVPNLCSECDTFFEKATAMLPERRFANAREFRLALMRVYEASHRKAKLDGLPPTESEMPAPPPPFPEPPPQGWFARVLTRIRNWRR